MPDTHGGTRVHAWASLADRCLQDLQGGRGSCCAVHEECMCVSRDCRKRVGPNAERVDALMPHADSEVRMVRGAERLEEGRTGLPTLPTLSSPSTKRSFKAAGRINVNVHLPAGPGRLLHVRPLVHEQQQLTPQPLCLQVVQAGSTMEAHTCAARAAMHTMRAGAAAMHTIHADAAAMHTMQALNWKEGHA
jgi:hypothetical protein